ncbi:MAG: hypothetical protein RBT36_11815 [Desulfobulbus sp.]|nr:hypothetical protein [Desulfobulbus sp.]
MGLYKLPTTAGRTKRIPHDEEQRRGVTPSPGPGSLISPLSYPFFQNAIALTRIKEVMLCLQKR